MRKCKEYAILRSNSRRIGMPKVSSKRQITLPVSQCEALGIEPGDEVESYIFEGHITIIKKQVNAAKGLLKNIKTDHSMSDEESLQSAL